MSEHDTPKPGHPNEPDQPADEEFKRLLDEYAKAVAEDRTADQEALSLRLLAHVGAKAEAEPTPDLLLKEEALRCEELADWVGAEAAYRKVLDLEWEATAAVRSSQGDLAGAVVAWREAVASRQHVGGFTPSRRGPDEPRACPHARTIGGMPPRIRPTFRRRGGGRTQQSDPSSDGICRT